MIQTLQIKIYPLMITITKKMKMVEYIIISNNIRIMIMIQINKSKLI